MQRKDGGDVLGRESDSTLLVVVGGYHGNRKKHTCKFDVWRNKFNLINSISSMKALSQLAQSREIWWESSRYEIIIAILLINICVRKNPYNRAKEL
jgi:hypothetical protein